MKPSWFIGIIFIYVAMQLLIAIAEGSLSWSDKLDVLAKPIVTNVSSLSWVQNLGVVGTFMLNIGAYVIALIEIIFLWSPTLFAGDWMIVYFFTGFPIAIGTIIYLVTAKGN